MKIQILDYAQADLEAAAQFYENQSPGLGNYFLENLFSDIDSLNIYAGIHLQVFGYFRLLSKKFPYAIYYLMDNTSINVCAVLDCRQNPNQTIKKLLQRNIESQTN